MKTFYLSNLYEEDKEANDLIAFLEEKFSEIDGFIYYAFPIIKEMDKPEIYPNVFFLSREYGIYAFVCDEITENRDSSINRLIEKKESLDSQIYSKLIKNKKLCKSARFLKFNFEVIMYLPNYSGCINNSEDKIFTTLNDIGKYIENSKNTENNEDIILEIMATLEGTDAIIKPKTREVNTESKNSKVYVLSKLEADIARFDDMQRVAALSMLDGPQRIRGLAGTGKTIILCMKAAMLHYRNPNKKILYTFYTKSLYDYIQQLITRFYMKISDGRIPDFENHILIKHAWGGENLKGVYYDTCISNNIKPLILKDVKSKENPFDYICNELINESNAKLNKEYDVILIDEAQDFSSSFYQLCRLIVKDDNLIWGYDELQNIFNVKIQNTLETFRNNRFKISGISLKMLAKKNVKISNDIVLSKSYRNIKEILVTAHAIGFGIYNDILIQSLENNEHWEDLGYEVLQGDCSKNEEVIIKRKEENSPLKIPEEYKKDDMIVTYSATNIYDEIDWIVNQIKEAIEIDGLKPDDIAIISIDDKYSHKYEELLRTKLYNYKIDINSIISKNYIKGFVRQDAVTFSSVYKAKGNEAAMVFVIGCEIFESNKNDRSMRNKIFTAFTRAKVWLRITGCNIENGQLLKEMNLLESNDYNLKFLNKPSVILQRDWDENSRRVEMANELVNDVKERLKQQGINVEEFIKLFEERNKDNI